jgi:hypothetical protein
VTYLITRVAIRYRGALLRSSFNHMKSDSQKAGDKGQSMFQQAKDTVSDTFSGDNSKFYCSSRGKQGANYNNDRQVRDQVDMNMSRHIFVVNGSR